MTANALTFAVKNGYTSLCQLLLEDKRVGPSSIVSSGAIDIACSVSNNNVQIVSLCLQYCRSKLTWSHLNRFIFQTVESNQRETFALLVKDPLFTVSDFPDQIALTCAEWGFEDLVMLMLDRFRIYSKNELFQMCCSKGLLSCVQRLLNDVNVDPTANDGRALHLAAQQGHPSVVQLLIETKSVHPASGENSALKFASYNGHLKCVQLLLACDDVDPNAQNRFALRFAAKNGHTAIVRLLERYSERTKGINSSRLVMCSIL